MQDGDMNERGMVYTIPASALRSLQIVSGIYHQTKEHPNWSKGDDKNLFLQLTKNETLLVQLGLYSILALPNMGVDKDTREFAAKLSEIIDVQIIAGDEYLANAAEEFHVALDKYVNQGEIEALEEFIDKLDREEEEEEEDDNAA